MDNGAKDLFSADAWWRAWPALLTILLPLAIALVYALSVDHLVGKPSWDELLKVTPNKEPIDFFARDVAGRIQFGIASTLLRIAACAAVILATIVLARRVGTRAAIGIVGALVIGLIVIYAIERRGHYLDYGKIRIVIEKISRALTQSGEVLANIDRAILDNLLASFVGGACMLACFAAVALRAERGDTAAASLQARMRDLERTTIFSAVFLVLLTALNKSLVDWPQAFLGGSEQKAYAYLAGAIGTFWGTFSALTLVFALIPAFIGLKLDIDKAAQSDGRKDQDAADWKKGNGLEFDAKSGIGAAIAAAAPILTVPGIDLASKLLH